MTLESVGGFPGGVAKARNPGVTAVWHKSSMPSNTTSQVGSRPTSTIRGCASSTTGCSRNSSGKARRDWSGVDLGGSPL